MIRINYITNLDVKNYSGGWSGMNHHIYQQLSREFDIHLIQNINPPYYLNEKIISRMLRMAGLKGLFPAFTQRRLRRIKSSVERELENDRQLNFFHGSTPWLLVNNKLPYAIYLDCCFATYISVYHNPGQFNKKQINDLFQKELLFLKNARQVFFSSEWALEEARSRYKINGQNFSVAGLGGALDIDVPADENTEPYFLFAGLDFLGKGGDKVVEAFEIVHKDHSSFKLKIAGQEPPDKYRHIAAVKYEGLLEKSDNNDLKKLTKLFANAFCFILPTSRDMTPLVLVEASALGCPVISTNSFGIPEIIKHRETGILLDAEKPLVDQLVTAMKELIENKTLRQELISNSRTYIRNNFTWSKTGQIIRNKIAESFPEWKNQM